MHTYICLSSWRFLTRGFSWAFCLEGFVRGGFCPSPLLFEYIHYNGMLNITFNFMFHMYEVSFKVGRHMLLDPWAPSSVTNCHTSNPLSSVTYFMDGPLTLFSKLKNCYPRKFLMTFFINDFTTFLRFYPRRKWRANSFPKLFSTQF